MAFLLIMQTMTTILLDTYQLIGNLKSRGFTEEQARGVSDAIQQIDLSAISTKADLRELELRMTIKLGSLIIAGVAFLAVLKFFG